MDDPDLNPVDIDPERIRAAIQRWRARVAQIDHERSVLSRRLAVYEQLLEISIERRAPNDPADPSDPHSTGARPSIAQACARIIADKSPVAGLTTSELLYLLQISGLRVGGVNPRATLLTALKRSDLVYESPVERGRWYATQSILGGDLEGDAP